MRWKPGVSDLHQREKPAHPS
ncbi:protein of unknown function [Azospirillum baldaniorum]|uniref:Uncharacterized protein n=1 Tax=Azospirillum baldaniorum TaxID=1064539 RepID=A0A9P1NMW0_9PROT|nr:protein of unknown function [Azospirillum baldaniorum]